MESNGNRKYIDSEKLIAEIERQINGAIYDMASSNTHQVEKGAVRKKTLDTLLSFITSLQQEQPEVDK